MGMLGNKSFIQVLIDKKPETEEAPAPGYSSGEALESCMKQFITAVKEDNAQKAVRALKMCVEMIDEMEDENSKESSKSVF